MKRLLSLEDCYLKDYTGGKDHYYHSIDNFMWIWKEEYKDGTPKYSLNTAAVFINLGLKENITKTFPDLTECLEYAMQIEKKYIKHNETARIKGMMRLGAMIGKLKCIKEN